MITPNILATSSFTDIIQENKYFFGCFFLFLIIGGILLSVLQTGDVLLFFSNHRSLFGDFFFKYFTKAGEEMAYIGFVLIFLYTKRRKAAFLIPFIGVVVTLVSFLGKRFFLHPRPSEYYKGLGQLQDINLIEGVHLVKGYSSFPSGHTMSAFALFTLVALLVSKKKWLAVLLFLFAFLVGLSRVYLVQHFLKDIYLGAITGVLIALIVYRIAQKTNFTFQRPLKKLV